MTVKPIKASGLHGALATVLGVRTGAADGDAAATSALDPELAERHPLGILVTEDNVVNQRLALRLLEKLGYRADVAGNGLEALEALERQPYDLVLMDVQMPEMDGVEATGRILERWTETERPWIVAMTAEVMQGDQGFLAAGMNDYVAKPIRPRELVAAITRAPRRRVEHEGKDGGRPAVDAAVLDRLAESMGGDDAFVAELVEQFVADSPALVAAARSGLETGDAEEVRRAAHTLKSNAATMGANELADRSRRLELAAKAGGSATGRRRSTRSPRSSSGSTPRSRGLAVALGLEQRHGLRDPLELERPELAQPEPVRRDELGEALSDEDLVGAGLRGDARRDVDRPAEVVALVVDHRSRLDADVRRREPAWAHRLHDVERRENGVPRIGEVEVDTVAQHLHDRASPVGRDLAHEIGEREGDARRRVVARLLGQPRVAGEVGERGGTQVPLSPFVDAGALEGDLRVLVVVFEHERLRMTAEQPPEHVLAGATELQAPPAEAPRTPGCRRALSPERLLDRRVEMMDEILRDPTGRVAPDAREPKDHLEIDAGLQQDRGPPISSRSSSRMCSSGIGRGSP